MEMDVYEDGMAVYGKGTLQEKLACPGSNPVCFHKYIPPISRYCQYLRESYYTPFGSLLRGAPGRALPTIN